MLSYVLSCEEARDHRSIRTSNTCLRETTGYFPAALKTSKVDIFDEILGRFTAVTVTTPVDIFKEISGASPALLVASKEQIFDGMLCAVLGTPERGLSSDYYVKFLTCLLRAATHCQHLFWQLNCVHLIHKRT